MKTAIQKFYYHMCQWSIVYVVMTYSTFSIINVRYQMWRDPYAISMCIISMFYIVLMFGAQFILFLYDYYKKENKETKS